MRNQMTSSDARNNILQKQQTLFSVKGTAWKLTSCIVLRAGKGCFFNINSQLVGIWCFNQQVLSGCQLAKQNKDEPKQTIQTRTRVEVVSNKIFGLIFHKENVYADFEDVRPGCGSGVESLPTCVRPGTPSPVVGKRAAGRPLSQESEVSHHLSSHLFPQNVFQFIKTNSSSVGTQSNASKSWTIYLH